jgi:glutathione S-transferase
VLTLYYRADCPQSLRIRIILAEKLLPFTRRLVAHDERALDLVDDPAAGAPPVLVDGSYAVADPMVIAEYVEDAFAKPALRPFDARGRALLRAAMRRIDREVMSSLERGRAREPASEGDRAPGIARAWREALATWENKLGGNGLLFGMEFSLADVWLVSAVEHAKTRGLGLPSSFPKLGLWLSRLRERASIRAERLAAPKALAYT